MKAFSRLLFLCLFMNGLAEASTNSIRSIIYPGEKLVINFGFTEKPESILGQINFLKFSYGGSFNDFWDNNRTNHIDVRLYDGDKLLGSRRLTYSDGGCCEYLEPGSPQASLATTAIDMSSVINGTIDGRIEYIPHFTDISKYSNVDLAWSFSTGTYRPNTSSGSFMFGSDPIIHSHRVTPALTLEGRDLDGDPSTFEAYYDTTLDITWLADANLAASNTFGLAYNADLGDYSNNAYTDPYSSSYTEQILSDGRMTWGAGLHWIDAMNADGGTGYLGYNDWRLPFMMDTDASGCDFANSGSDCGDNARTGDVSTTVFSEMASLYYDTLGNLASSDASGNFQPGWGLTNIGPFSNLQANGYWFGLEYAPSTRNAWLFDFFSGDQNYTNKREGLYIWPVRDGDVINTQPTAICDIAPITVAGHCTGEVVAKSLSDIDDYVASNFGKMVDENNKFSYKNLRLVGAIGQAGIPLGVTSPCRIIVNANASLTASDITLHARMGVVADWSADFYASNQACLVSDKRGVFLKGGNLVQANSLALRGNQKAFVGHNATLNVTGPVELVSTGTGDTSQVKIGTSTVVNADSFTMAADNTAEIAYKASVSSTGELAITSGNLASSETHLNAHCNLQAGTNIALTSGGKTTLGYQTAVTAGNILDISAKAPDHCSVANVSSLVYGSASGNCLNNLLP